MTPRRIALLAVLIPSPALAQWSHYAGVPARIPLAASSAPDLAQPLWTTDQTASGSPIVFDAPAGPIVHSGRVFAPGTVAGQPSLLAFDAATGAHLWDAPVPAPELDSWSTPAADGNAVLFGSGDLLIAFDTSTGAELWRTTLQLPIVNASPCITSDLGPADRVFLTDYDGSYSSFDGGSLYCINLDPFDPALNPYQPGEIVWRAATDAALSGASPAYHNGNVYIADAGDPFFGVAGRVHAFDATATASPAPLWSTDDPGGDAYFGGVSVSGGAVYAASYDFAGTQFSATLTKLDASTGSVVWSTPANRTSSVPIPLSDGRVLLSTGIDGFGSIAALQLFTSTGTLLWDSALDSWNDDGDNTPEPGEYLALGGWTHLPAVIETSSATLIATGTLPSTSLFSGYSQLSLLDLRFTPSDASFVRSSASGAANSPALSGGLLYTTGPGGLHAYGSAAPSFDIDGSGAVTTEDLYAWHATPTDLDGDGQANTADALALEAALRESTP